MFFNFKNARTTYQKSMEKKIQGLYPKNVKVYVDNMVVKSKSCNRHEDLNEVFILFIKNNIRLNPEKCVFEVEGR